MLEKDFSPTLAGDDLAGDRSSILRWLREVPERIGRAAPDIRLGVKVMNALFDDDMQVDMLEACASGPMPPAFLVVFNRLYDPERRVAYGGWDLSERNLRALELAAHRGVTVPPLSATGNVCSGRVMIEYATRGCENAQVHTFFQVPRAEYTAVRGRRSACALHTLLLHPTTGLVPWMWHLQEAGYLEPVDGVVRFRDLIGRAVS